MLSKMLIAVLAASSAVLVSADEGYRGYAGQGYGTHHHKDVGYGEYIPKDIVKTEIVNDIYYEEGPNKEILAKAHEYVSAKGPEMVYTHTGYIPEVEGMKSKTATMKVLIAGGCGYIGSHVVREMTKLNEYDIVLLDNLSTGHYESALAGIKLEKGDIRDAAFLKDVFTRHKPDAVMHLCASIEAGESVKDPLPFWDNNVYGTQKLLEAMRDHGCKYFVFSSTAALFGLPKRIPIDADDPIAPINPYGDTKFAVEMMLKACDTAYGIKSVSLRYFNACGADASGDIGEVHDPESHLIPILLQVALGKREKAFLFGDDYETKDGTCIRDYIHVTDLASAHIKAIDYLVKHNKSDRFNLGSGQGFSVKEIVEAVRKVTGHPLPVEIKERRPGDPPVLVAASEKAEEVLGWRRNYTNIEDIVATAWNFHKKRPNGY